MKPPRPSPRGMRLATWLLALISACVLPLLAMAAWLAYEEVAARHAERERDAAAMAQVVANGIDQFVRTRVRVLQMLAGSPLLDEPTRWSEFYREAQGLHAAFGSHVIVTAPGDSASAPLRMLLNTRVPWGSALPPLPQPSGPAAMLAAQQTGQPAVGDLFPGPLAQEPLLALAVPLPGAAGRGHVLFSTHEARQFQQRLEEVVLPPDWTLSLFDGRGEVIARRAPAGFVPGPPGTIAGRHRVTLTAAPWAVELEIPRDVLLAPARQAALALVLAIAAATLLAFGSGLLAARRLRRAVAALAEPGAVAATGIVEIDQARGRLDTAARRRDDALAAERVAQAQLRTTFDLAHVGIAHVGLDGRWLRVNRRLCQIVGYTEAELLAVTFQDITHPDDMAADLAQVQQLLAGEIAGYETEKRYRHRDGREIWVTLTVALVHKVDGTPDYFISVVEDISARKRLEQQAREQIEALRESEAYRRRLFEQLADGVLLVDVEGRILDANTHAEVMLGAAPGELATLRLPDLLANSDHARLAEEVPRLMAGHMQLTEWEQRRRDGSAFPSEVSVRPLDEQRFVAVLRDISGRRQADQALLRYQVELSELTQRLIAQERATTRRVAQALHDRLGQTLAVARLRLGTLVLRHGSATVDERDAALGQLGMLLEQAVAEARQVLAELRPPFLEDQGLAAALDNELRRPGQGSGADAVLTLDATAAAQAQRWPADAEYAAFMVAREAVANALSHAQARHIVVRLDGGPRGLRLEVVDDGIGLATALLQGRPGHLGIVGMRERALAVGAHFTVASLPEGGTRMSLTWGAVQP